MSEKKTSFLSTIQSFNKTFWLASFMELMERWAWYGIFTLFGLYLVGSTDEGGLGFNHIQKGNIMANVTAILYFLPIFFGVIADNRLQTLVGYFICNHDFGLLFHGRSQHLLEHVHGISFRGNWCGIF